MKKRDAEIAYETLVEAVGEVTCGFTTDQLAGEQDEAPEFGTTDYIEFISRCPAFDRFLEKRQAVHD